MKDTPIDRLGPRERLVHSLDAIIHETVPPSAARDAVEGKLFGIGLESYTVGSHELYFGYALSRRVLYTLDMGHYHPTESVADKLSAVLGFLPEVLLHVSRGVRWDSDHVVILNDDLMALAQQLVRGQFLPRTHLGLDYFDASINRVAAWVIGCRNLIEALLAAMLEPVDRLRAAEVAGDLTERLALLEDSKLLPFGAVWDFYCARSGVPTREAWFREIRRYERDVLAARC
jgi:L-rhamnose isomerase